MTPRGEKITQYISCWMGQVLWDDMAGSHEKATIFPVRRREQDPTQVFLPLDDLPLFPFLFPVPQFAGEVKDPLIFLSMTFPAAES